MLSEDRVSSYALKPQNLSFYKQAFVSDIWPLLESMTKDSYHHLKNDRSKLEKAQRFFTGIAFKSFDICNNYFQKMWAIKNKLEPESSENLLR